MKSHAIRDHLYSGTSGLVLPYKNKQLYPAAFREGSRLTYYGSLFNSIEINSSFYKIPKPSTVERWSAEVSEDFRFTFKLWKEITHVKDLEFDPASVIRFMNTIGYIGQKKGCLLVQFPPGLRFTRLSKVRDLLANLMVNDPERLWNLALEFRHPSWYRAETFRLLDDCKAGLVIHDKTGSQAPLEDLDTAFVYIRFHGPGGNYQGSYEDAFLLEYAHYLRDWINQGKECYAYFNNTIGDAIGNLRQLNLAIQGLSPDQGHPDQQG